jgi:sucrose-6-phosphate hydrolase SacC (GH32 family)
MKRKEVPGNIRYMKNIIQYKRMSSSSNNRMTSMQNTQTCSIVDLDLITTIVALVDRKAIEITSNVIRGAGVTISIRVYLV